MKNMFLVTILILSCTALSAQVPDSIKANMVLIKQHIYADYKGMFRKPVDHLHYPFIVPGSASYSNALWDWDSWLSDVALRQILLDQGTEKDKSEALPYEQGCVLNFLEYTGSDGYMNSITGKGLRVCTTGRMIWPLGWTMTHAHFFVRRVVQHPST
jgi:hypothetical protein